MTRIVPYSQYLPLLTEKEEEKLDDNQCIHFHKGVDAVEFYWGYMPRSEIQIEDKVAIIGAPCMYDMEEFHRVGGRDLYGLTLEVSVIGMKRPSFIPMSRFDENPEIILRAKPDKLYYQLKMPFKDQDGKNSLYLDFPATSLIRMYSKEDMDKMFRKEGVIRWIINRHYKDLVLSSGVKKKEEPTHSKSIIYDMFDGTF